MVALGVGVGGMGTAVWVPILAKALDRNRSAGPVTLYAQLATIRVPTPTQRAEAAVVAQSLGMPREPGADGERAWARHLAQPRPSVRTVVFRGMLSEVARGGGKPGSTARAAAAAAAMEAGDSGLAASDPAHSVLTFCTDIRSSKVAEIAACPWGELAWYMPKSREQWRVSGRLTVVSHGMPEGLALGSVDLAGARRSLWERLSDGARAQFAWPAPGEARPRYDYGSGGVLDTGPFELTGDSIPTKESALDTFCLVLLEPDSVDRLELKGEPQSRTLFVLDQDSGDWTREDVNP